jgi:hypothetical protein
LQPKKKAKKIMWTLYTTHIICHLCLCLGSVY